MEWKLETFDASPVHLPFCAASSSNKQYSSCSSYFSNCGGTFVSDCVQYETAGTGTMALGVVAIIFYLPPIVVVFMQMLCSSRVPKHAKPLHWFATISACLLAVCSFPVLSLSPLSGWSVFMMRTGRCVGVLRHQATIGQFLPHLPWQRLCPLCHRADVHDSEVYKCVFVPVERFLSPCRGFGAITAKIGNDSVSQCACLPRFCPSRIKAAETAAPAGGV